MIGLMVNGTVHEVNAGAFRCRECAHLGGESGAYTCALFGVAPVTFSDLFAPGDAGRTRVCDLAEAVATETPVVTPARETVTVVPFVTQISILCAEARAHAAGIREGERRMLWAMAVAAEWWLAFDQCRDDYECRGCAYDASDRALRALRDLGDADAAAILGGGR